MEILSRAVFWALCATLLQSCRALDGHVVWYIDPSSGSTNSTCDRDSSQPCSSIESVFQQSEVVNDTSSCYESRGDLDDRESTTIFLTGSVYVPASCLRNWRNLRFASYPPGSQAVVNTDRFGSASIFSFYNCTNVTLEGLLFNTSSQGRQNLLLESCTDVTIRRCAMPLTTADGYGVEFSGSGGRIVIEDSEFYGPPNAVHADNHGIALRIVTGSDSTFTYSSNAVYPAMSVEIRGCNFTNLFSNGCPLDSYREALRSALSILVQLRRGAYNNRLLVEDSYFANITNSMGHSVTVHFDSGSVNNSAVFTGCVFEGNRVRYGGGVATYFSGSDGSLNGSLEISNCTFADNLADYEGGAVFVAFLQEDIANQVSINHCRFYRNRALYGAAVFFFNSPQWYLQAGSGDAVAQPLTPANIDYCTFSFNSASLEEGIVNALRMRLGISNR